MTISNAAQVLNAAEGLYKMRPTWMLFYREICGIGGAIQQMFPTPAELAEWNDSPERVRVDDMLEDLREAREEEREAMTVITVRMPKRLHQQLKDEAHAAKQSMNRFCVLRLSQPPTVADAETSESQT